jgi:hypothetical protein
MAQKTAPQSKTAAEKIAAVRKWSKDRGVRPASKIEERTSTKGGALDL